MFKKILTTNRGSELLDYASELSVRGEYRNPRVSIYTDAERKIYRKSMIQSFFAWIILVIAISRLVQPQYMILGVVIGLVLVLPVSFLVGLFLFYCTMASPKMREHRRETINLLKNKENL